jgi:hypothetical protein
MTVRSDVEKRFIWSYLPYLKFCRRVPYLSPDKYHAFRWRYPTWAKHMIVQETKPQKLLKKQSTTS